MTKLEVRLSTTLEVPTTQAESKSEVPPHDGEVLSGEVLRPSATELTGSPRWAQQQLRRNSTNTAVLLFSQSSIEVGGGGPWDGMHSSSDNVVVAGRKAWTRPCVGSCEVSMDALLAG